MRKIFNAIILLSLLSIPTFAQRINGNELRLRQRTSTPNCTAGSGTIWFDDATNSFRKCENGGASAPLVSAGAGTGDALVADPLSQFAATTSAQLKSVLSDELGDASGKAIFALGTLAIASGKTATFSNTLTFSGTDSSTVALGAGGTVLYSGGAGGTPSSITLTNGTGLPIAGITGLGSGVGTFLATPSSSNLASALTGETGTAGGAVFSISPQLTTPEINDTSADHQYVLAVSELAADRTITLPLLAGNDTFTFNAFAATLTNKTITASSNILGGVTMTLGSDADGDIYYRASNVLTRLAKGTAGQVLTMNAGATAPEWAAGGGGSPGGSSGQLQYNNAGAFAGSLLQQSSTEILFNSAGLLQIGGTSSQFQGLAKSTDNVNSYPMALLRADVSSLGYLKLNELYFQTGSYNSAGAEASIRANTGMFLTRSIGIYSWASGSSANQNDSPDTAMGRNAAGVVEVNNGTGGVFRDLLARGLRSNAVAFASAISSPVEGTIQAFTDSSTATWGATITGGGANHVLGYWNGTNWTVIGK